MEVDQVPRTCSQCNNDMYYIEARTPMYHCYRCNLSVNAKEETIETTIETTIPINDESDETSVPYNDMA